MSLETELEEIKVELAGLNAVLASITEAALLDGIIEPHEQKSIDDMKALIKKADTRRKNLAAKKMLKAAEEQGQKDQARYTSNADATEEGEKWPLKSALSGSVGKGGQNNKDDAASVQQLINLYNHGERKPKGKGLVIDGLAGGKTGKAIIKFQSDTSCADESDMGLVKPGSATWDSLKSGGKVQPAPAPGPFVDGEETTGKPFNFVPEDGELVSTDDVSPLDPATVEELRLQYDAQYNGLAPLLSGMSDQEHEDAIGASNRVRDLLEAEDREGAIVALADFKKLIANASIMAAANSIHPDFAAKNLEDEIQGWPIEDVESAVKKMQTVIGPNADRSLLDAISVNLAALEARVSENDAQISEMTNSTLTPKDVATLSDGNLQLLMSSLLGGDKSSPAFGANVNVVQNEISARGSEAKARALLKAAEKTDIDTQLSDELRKSISGLNGALGLPGLQPGRSLRPELTEALEAEVKRLESNLQERAQRAESLRVGKTEIERLEVPSLEDMQNAPVHPNDALYGIDPGERELATALATNAMLDAIEAGQGLADGLKVGYASELPLSGGDDFVVDDLMVFLAAFAPAYQAGQRKFLKSFANDMVELAKWIADLELEDAKDAAKKLENGASILGKLMDTPYESGSSLGEAAGSVLAAAGEKLKRKEDKEKGEILGNAAGYVVAAIAAEIVIASASSGVLSAAKNAMKAVKNSVKAANITKRIGDLAAAAKKAQSSGKGFKFANEIGDKLMRKLRESALIRKLDVEISSPGGMKHPGGTDAPAVHSKESLLEELLDDYKASGKTPDPNDPSEAKLLDELLDQYAEAASDPDKGGKPLPEGFLDSLVKEGDESIGYAKSRDLGPELEAPAADANTYSAAPRLDDFKRPKSAETVINGRDLDPGKRPSNPKDLPAGHERGIGYEIFHLIAHELGGATKPGNLTTASKQANRFVGEWDKRPPSIRAVEIQVRQAVNAGETVKYKVTPIYAGDNVPYPEAFHVQAASKPNPATGSEGLKIDTIIRNWSHHP